jgi:hypothetical protein
VFLLTFGQCPCSVQPRPFLRAATVGRDIQRYYPAPKKREISVIFLWSKVLLDKGITNRTIGQSLRVDFPKSKPQPIQSKKERKLSSIGRNGFIYWSSCTVALDSINMAASAPRPCLRCSKVSAHCCCGCCAHYCVVCTVRYPQCALLPLLQIVRLANIWCLVWWRRLRSSWIQKSVCCCPVRELTPLASQSSNAAKICGVKSGRGELPHAAIGCATHW